MLRQGAVRHGASAKSTSNGDAASTRRPQFRRLLPLRAANEGACRLLYVGDDFAKMMSRARRSGRVVTRINNEVRGINRAANDVTSKPPGTIEWE
jgi:hypothetical protein